MNAKAVHMKLCNTAGVPRYQQIKDAITQKISSGEWQPGHMLPSENQLAAQLGASRMTINRPLRELTNQGLLKRVHGVGTFVAEPPRHASLLELRSIAEEIKSQGKQHRAEVLSLKTLKARGDVVARMAIARGGAVYRIVVVHYQDDVPIQLESRYVNAAMVPAFIDVDFTGITTTEYLISQVRPDQLEHIVQAIMPDKFTASHLVITCSEPCLKLRRRTWKNGDVITAVDMIYPGSRYDLGARYSPSGSQSTHAPDGK